ncbi:MAG: tRNA-dihydrouridine synthase family protein [Opitutae bacterium]
MLNTLAPGTMPDKVRDLFPAFGFPTALAPMQDVTGLSFMNLVSGFGPPDLFFTEYFRVHCHARIDPSILSSITENISAKPVFAQLIGEDLEHIARFARELQQYPIAGIDLNLGCPAPRVYRKNVGGGLLRHPARINELLQVLRDTCQCPLTVKTRIGFEDSSNFSEILDIFATNQIELLSLHARTVRGGYRSFPQYNFVNQAVQRLGCPVLLNGEVNTPFSAIDLIRETGAAGVMIGRSAIRNPWIFLQIRQLQCGQEMFHPTLADLYHYIQALYRALSSEDVAEEKQVARLKKFLNFVGLSVDQEGGFLHHMRRAKTRSQLDKVCQNYLIKEGKAIERMSLAPYNGLVALSSAEGPSCQG